MDEARKKIRRKKSQRGQAILEFLLILLISLVFLRTIFFNQNFGLKAMLDRTMLRLGVYLEQNLKSGTKPGGEGEKSLEAFAGTNTWSN